MARWSGTVGMVSVDHAKVVRGTPPDARSESCPHLEHGAVIGQHLARQLGDAGRSRERRQAFYQERPDPSALPVVVDQQRELGVDGLQPLVGGHPHDEPTVFRDNDRVVGVRGPCQSNSDLPIHVGGSGEEPEVPALTRHAPMQVQQWFVVAGPGRSEEDDGSVHEEGVAVGDRTHGGRQRRPRLGHRGIRGPHRVRVAAHRRVKGGYSSVTKSVA